MGVRAIEGRLEDARVEEGEEPLEESFARPVCFPRELGREDTIMGDAAEYYQAVLQLGVRFRPAVEASEGEVIHEVVGASVPVSRLLTTD